MKNETSEIAETAKETVVELTPEQLMLVAGGLNPQPLPPFVAPRF